MSAEPVTVSLPPVPDDPIDRLGKLMARLNTKNVRFDIGSGGGRPALTAQDVAAALGMIPAGIGRDLLEYVFWPASYSSKSRRTYLLSDLLQLQLEQHNHREREVMRAIMKVATDGPHAGRAAFDKAHRERWPAWIDDLGTLKASPKWEAIRLGVLEELAHPRQCPACRGIEAEDKQGRIKTCPRCQGRGTVEFGDTRRAERLGMKRAGYIARWKEPYEWLLDVARSSMSTTADALLRKLR